MPTLNECRGCSGKTLLVPEGRTKNRKTLYATVCPRGYKGNCPTPGAEDLAIADQKTGRAFGASRSKAVVFRDEFGHITATGKPPENNLLDQSEDEG